jgi:hypothetical protein
VRFLGDDFVFLDLRCKQFFFFGAKFCQNENIKVKKNIMSPYFLSLFLKNGQILRKKILNYFLPHLDSAFSLVTNFN